MKLKKLCKRLGKAVLVPPDRQPMRLVEIYSNGNVACVPMICFDYKRDLIEFHAESIKSVHKKGGDK